MKIERHVFGSKTGYTTLARSEGLNASDCRKLEVFAFGQTSNRGYLQSLAKVPAYISRPLDGNRRAITRVFPGQTDNKGRNTLLLISVVLGNSDWIGVLKGDVLPLLNNADLWKWDGQPSLASINSSIPGPNPLSLDRAEATEIVGLISEIERLCASRQNVVISEPKYTLTTVRAIEMLIPDSAKRRFSCAARSLSANLDVNLNCVARDVGVSSVGPDSQVYRPRTDGILSPYATELVRGQIIQGRISRDVIRSYRGFGTIEEEIMMADDVMPVQQSELPNTHNRTTLRTRKERTPMSSTQKTILGFCIFTLMACSVIGYGIYQKYAAEDLKTAAQQHREENAQEAATLCNTELQDFVLLTAEERETLLNNAERVAREIGEDDKCSELAKKNAQKLSTQQGKLNEVHKDLKGYEDQIRSIKSTLAKPLSVEKSGRVSEQSKMDVKEAEEQAITMANASIAKGIQLSKTVLRIELKRIDNEIKNRRRRLEQHDRNERLKAVEGKLKSLTLGFQKKGRRALRKVLDEYKVFMKEYHDVMDEEKTLGPELEDLILKAKLAEADAQDRFMAGDNQMKAQVEGREITLLMQTHLSNADDTGKAGKEKNIKKRIAVLIELDSDYGKALSAVFNKLQERSDENKQRENG